MNLRAESLPPGWYPRNPDEISRFLSGFSGKSSGEKALAALSPHAGWYYSGKIAAAALSAVDPATETLVILGGHLLRGMAPLYAEEEGVRTPLGPVAIDGELREAVRKEIPGREDRFRDNTVEVLLPMVRFFLPDAKILWLRLPAEESSFEAGRIIAGALRELGRKGAVIGSTDLTHYGDNYGFSPRGRGLEALQWVKEVNDRRFIEAVEGGDPAAVLSHAEQDRSACSAGAVLGVLGYAAALNAGPARLLAYGTSAEAHGTPLSDDDAGSFVGYAAFGWYPQTDNR
ncbi:MAG: AmmeMemoRadiSam system protein B [Treponema sp.]|jgi:AmmeMemoRadiSam system protein B|nr:AmmeMemoRadiSam system protein B [Treponema sp.]